MWASHESSYSWMFAFICKFIGTATRLITVPLSLHAFKGSFPQPLHLNLLPAFLELCSLVDVHFVLHVVESAFGGVG